MRVLFVVKEFLPKPTPNGLCITHVRRALYEKGVKSDVLMAGEKDGIFSTDEIGDIFSIKVEFGFENRKVSIFHYITKRIPMLFSWPIPSNERVRDYQKMIEKYDAERHYDAIIGTMFPADVCVACSRFDRFILYELDSLINNPMYKIGFKRHLHGRLERLERQLYDRADLIIHLNNNKIFYSKEKYKKWATKSVYSDVPNLLPTTENAAYKVNDDYEIPKTGMMKKVMVYSGCLSRDFRSPTRLIDLLKSIAKQQDIQCFFFTRGDCEDELRKAEEDTNGLIKRMGYVSQDVLKEYYKKADFLLDIGNCLSGEDYSVPSKVFSYMSEGKPIIHMNGTNDSAIQYLDKYGLAINVDAIDSIDKATQKVLAFMSEYMGKHADFAEVAGKFPQNTPEYTADLIIHFIEEKSIN